MRNTSQEHQIQYSNFRGIPLKALILATVKEKHSIISIQNIDSLVQCKNVKNGELSVLI